MKNLLITLVVSFLVAFSQAQTVYLSDDFEDGNIDDWVQGSVGDWIASTDNPITGSYSLKHNLVDTTAHSSIRHVITGLDVSAGVTSWRFNVKTGNFDPTSTRKFLVLIMVHDTTNVNGYAVGIDVGGESDSLTLWRITGSVQDSLIIQTDFDWDANTIAGIEVTRDAAGVWELKYDTNGGFDNLVAAGTGFDDTYTAANYFGVTYYFKTSSAGAFWLDDILIQDGQRIYANTKALLQGPFSADTMATDLAGGNYLPTTQPFAASPWNYNGRETVTSFNADVVDWVLVQLRTATDSASTVASRAAFIKKDGSIVDTDFRDGVSFSGIANGNYYVVIRHRNHLAIMSANTIALSGNSALYDFTTAQSQAYGSDPMIEVATGKFALITGDASANGQIQNDDKNDIWTPQLGTAGYRSADFNLNGQVQNDDKNDFWQGNLGKGTQVPN